MVLFIVSALIAVISLGMGIYLSLTFIRNVVPPIPFKKLLFRLLVVGSVFTLSFTTMMSSIYLWGKISPKPYEMASCIIGGLLVGSLGAVSLFTFMLHYWGDLKKKGVSETTDKWLFKGLMAAFPLFLISLFFLSEGFANYATYPLPNGINFQHGFVNPSSLYGPNIAFYALRILSGALYCYFILDHKFYLQYGKHGIAESTFLIAFPAGILGARIFYVIGNYSVEFVGQPWWKIFAIWEGGLTILGGAITGIVVGVAWFMWRNKGYSIWLAVDIIIPTILVAQAVGRWGNFFNCEVHGLAVDEKYWRWLPEIIFNNAHFSDKCPELVGQIYVPLFFIEGIANLLGYFVLAHVFGKKFRRFTELGDLGFGYIVWYGLTRVFMEPLRDANYKMGEKGYWSWVWALVFVVAGVLAIVGNHVVRYILKKKADKYNAKKSDKMVGLISSLVILALSGVLLTFGVTLLTSNSFVPTLVFNGFNNGLMLLILGIAVLSTLGISIPKFIEGIRYNQTTNE